VSKRLLHLNGKAHCPAPHVRCATSKIDPDTGWCCDHDRSRAANTRRNAAPSTLGQKACRFQKTIAVAIGQYQRIAKVF
jgi:hypothetical protein